MIINSLEDLIPDRTNGEIEIVCQLSLKREGEEIGGSVIA